MCCFSPFLYAKFKNKITKKIETCVVSKLAKLNKTSQRTTQDTGTIKETEQQIIATHSIQPVKTTESLCVCECVSECVRVCEREKENELHDSL
jgi:hypothetical protein